MTLRNESLGDAIVSIVILLIVGFSLYAMFNDKASRDNKAVKSDTVKVQVISDTPQMEPFIDHSKIPEP